jgi:hypothetical protein
MHTVKKKFVVTHLLKKSPLYGNMFAKIATAS